MRLYFTLIKNTKAKAIQCGFEQMNILCIMDTFSFETFKYEANFIQVTPNDWKDVCQTVKPDLLFVESVWQGKDHTWKGKISEISNEIIEIIAWAQQNNIPTVFWHKEVPPHFFTFMRVSKLFDFIFLTDENCIDRYKKSVAHERVYVLPFGCQPKIHNPVTTGSREQAAFFAGTYYPHYKYPIRAENFDALFDAISRYVDIHIYDRLDGKGKYRFPSKYTNHVHGSVPFSEMKNIYKKYQFGINMNSVKNSNTMYSRRVLELMASNTFVVGNHSDGIKKEFGDVMICSDDYKVIESSFKQIFSDQDVRQSLTLQGLRKVLKNHTCGQRLAAVYTAVNGILQDISPQVPTVVLADCKESNDIDQVVEMFDQQTCGNRKLYIVTKAKHDHVVHKHALLFEDGSDAIKAMFLQHDAFFLSIFNPHSFYGANYLLDMILAFHFAQVDTVTKPGSYDEKNNRFYQKNHFSEYTYAEYFYTSCSMMTSSFVKNLTYTQLVKEKIEAKCLVIDRFNYCKDQRLCPSISVMKNTVAGDKTLPV
ncbi:MAG: glycosyltransferase [Deltaproteobacteria bacterium]|nr:glycosyltransferase [Deltaproteobacteria bacterium]